MPHIDAQYAYNALGQTVVERLYTDDGAFNEPALEQELEAASAIVSAAASNSGLTVGDDPSTIVREATLGKFIEIAFGRKQIAVPDAYMERVRIADEIVEGKWQVKPNSVSSAVGGVSFGNRTVMKNRGPKLSPSKLRFI